MLLPNRNDVVVLPSPEDRPEAHVVIYDGECLFCRRGVARCARWDWLGQLAFLSLHSPEVAAQFPDLLPQDLMAEMVIVDRSGKRHRGAAAIRFLTRNLPVLWLAAPLLHVPGTLPLWKRLYAWVAHNRYRWGGRSCEGGTCRVGETAAQGPEINDPQNERRHE